MYLKTSQKKKEDMRMDAEKNNNEQENVYESTKRLKSWICSNLIAQGGSEAVPSGIDGRNVTIRIDEKAEHALLDFIVSELRNPDSRYYTEYCIRKVDPEKVIAEANDMTRYVD